MGTLNDMEGASTQMADKEKAVAGSDELRSKAILSPEDMESSSKVRKAILMLAWPVIIEQILSLLTQIVDSAMLGRLGAEVVAGVSLSFHPVMLVMGIFGGIAVGNTVLVARSIGAGGIARRLLRLLSSLCCSV